MSDKRDVSPARKPTKKTKAVQSPVDPYDWVVISVMAAEDASYVLAIPKAAFFDGFVDWLQNVWQKQDERSFLPDDHTTDWAFGSRIDDAPDLCQFRVFDRLGYFDTPTTDESYMWDTYLHLWDDYSPITYTGRVLHIATNNF